MVDLNVSLFLKGEELIGDVAVEIIGEHTVGEIPKGEGEAPQKTVELPVRLPNGDERSWTMNATSQRALATAWGKDTLKWVGKTPVLYSIDQNVMGKIKKVIYARMPV